MVDFAKFYRPILELWRGRRKATELLAGANNITTDSASVLIISHDAHLAGAQTLVLSLLAEWRRRMPFPVKVICVEDGPLRAEFEQLFPTLVLSDFKKRSSRSSALRKFTREPLRAIYSSTVVNGTLLEELRPLGIPVITHSHELQQSIQRWAPGKIMTATLYNSDYFLGGCHAVANNLVARHQVPRSRLEVIHDFIDPWNVAQIPDVLVMESLRLELGITATDIVVFGCGTTDWRKAPDIFLEVALRACTQMPMLKFFWIGGEPALFAERISASNLTGRIQFLGNKHLSRRYYYIGHLFALTSREDPCPLVALQAADACLPVICFENAGDIPMVLGDSCGVVVPYEDVAAFTEAITVLAGDTEKCAHLGQAGHHRVTTHHSSTTAAIAIENVIARSIQQERRSIGPRAPLVSVIVPNYNHHRYLPQRLATITAQTLRDIEIILLDDSSTDDSQTLLQSFANQERRARLTINQSNSGSTFKQWRKGMQMATGKYIWIAESDDAAHPAFLKTLVSKLESDSSIVVACSQLRMMDTDGNLGSVPDGWLNELDPLRWKTDFTNDGMDEISGYLAQKNTILNASGVVFRNFADIDCLVDDSMRLCADWLFWVRLLARGQLAYVAKPLNYWRLQSSNARNRPPGELEWQEGQKIIAEIGELLELEAQQREVLLNKFHERCIHWATG